MEWWQAPELGYLAGRPLEGDLWLVVAPMIYTYRVMLCTPAPYGGVHGFYCYTSYTEALRCFYNWDGSGPNPVDGWTKSHGVPVG